MRLLALCLLCSSVASAQSVSVHALSGDRGGRVRQALVDALRGAGLSAQADDAASGAVVEGTLSRRRLRLELSHDGRSTSIATGGRSAGQMANAAAPRIASWLGRPSAEPQAAPPAAQDELPSSPYDGPAPRAARRRASTAAAINVAQAATAWQDAPRTLEIAAGLALMSRRLDFVDDVRSHLNGYEILPAPQARASIAWFPMRSLSRELWANVGVVGDAQGVFALDSSQRQGQTTTYATRAWGASFGLRYELPFDRHFVALTTSYGEELFALDEGLTPLSATLRPSVISVHYRYLRPALSASFRLHDVLRVGVDTGWRFLLSSGGLDHSATGLPASDGAGFDVGVAVAVRLAWFCEVSLRAEYHRYFFGFHPQRTDWYAVGGAMDEWTSIGVDAVLLLPGTNR